MYNYIQMKHKTTGDELGQMLTYTSRDECLAKFHQEMKNAIGNADVIGLEVNVLDEHLQSTSLSDIHFPQKWIRETPVEVEG